MLLQFAKRGLYTVAGFPCNQLQPYSPCLGSLHSLRARSCMSEAVMEQVTEHKFGPWPIAHSEVFAMTDLSLAFVNLKPVVPGHVLIAPRRVVARFEDLNREEDGPEAGQTVPHVHIHVLPRKTGDFQRNDEIYDAIDASSKTLPRNDMTGEKLDLDAERVVRTREDMSAEAMELRKLFSL